MHFPLNSGVALAQTSEDLLALSATPSIIGQNGHCVWNGIGSRKRHAALKLLASAIMRQLDRRGQRTRAALMKAFAQLMLSEGYEAVTVESVCARANVGRSTFYLHFPGKEGILRESLAGPSSHLVALVAPEAAVETLRPILEHFHQQRRKNAVCFTHPVRAMWVKRLGELIEPTLIARAREIRTRPILPLQVVAQQIAEAQLALIATWLAAHPSTAPLTVAEALIAATRGMMGALLRCDQRAISTPKQ